MKSERGILFSICVTTFLLLLSCGNHPIWIYFTADEFRWMPYDTASVQEYFTDELGNVHELRLTHRNVIHEDIGSDMYNNRAVAELTLDSHLMIIDLYKEPDDGFFYHGPGRQLHCIINFADAEFEELNIPTSGILDSVTVGSTYYEGVLVWESDTVWNTNTQCWKIWYAKGKGLIRANFRNGRYYEIQ